MSCASWHAWCVSGKPDYSLEGLLTKGKETQCSASHHKYTITGPFITANSAPGMVEANLKPSFSRY